MSHGLLWTVHMPGGFALMLPTSENEVWKPMRAQCQHMLAWHPCQENLDYILSRSPRAQWLQHFGFIFKKIIAPDEPTASNSLELIPSLPPALPPAASVHLVLLFGWRPSMGALEDLGSKALPRKAELSLSFAPFPGTGSPCFFIIPGPGFVCFNAWCEPKPFPRDFPAVPKISSCRFYISESLWHRQWVWDSLSPKLPSPGFPRGKQGHCFTVELWRPAVQLCDWSKWSKWSGYIWFI